MNLWDLEKANYNVIKYFTSKEFNRYLEVKVNTILVKQDNIGFEVI